MIKYKRGYKYQVFETFSIQTALRPETTISLDYITLDTFGLLTIYKGYAWDGASGPSFDTKSFMRGSCVHDAIYQLIYHELLPYSTKAYADDLLIFICNEDGMLELRQKWVHKAVEVGGDPRPSRIKPVLTAP
jgi:hypothetical protein